MIRWWLEIYYMLKPSYIFLYLIKHLIASQQNTFGVNAIIFVIIYNFKNLNSKMGKIVLIRSIYEKLLNSSLPPM